MPEIINNFNSIFIGTVYGINPETREVDVYIPKLMGAIPEGREKMTVPVNMGNKKISISHNDSLNYLSTITIPAEDKDAEMPKVGSKVLIRFLDGSVTLGHWGKWNPNGDYEIIEEEKYPLQCHITVGDKILPINLLDNIIIELPEGYSYIVKNDENNKEKVISLIKDQTLDSRVSLLEDMIGHETVDRVYIDDSNVAHTETIEASGLYKTIEEMQKTISELSKKIS